MGSHRKPRGKESQSIVRFVSLVEAELQTRQYSRHTERAYLAWIHRFLGDGASGSSSVEAVVNAKTIGDYLGRLATKRQVSRSTQNQALAALAFLFEATHGTKLGDLKHLIRPRHKARTSRLLGPEEVGQLLLAMDGSPRLMAALMFGAGLRLMECCRLRVKDVDLKRRTLLVRKENGKRQRAIPLPNKLLTEIQHQLNLVRHVHQHDLRVGAGWVELPGSTASRGKQFSAELEFQWFFPAIRYRAQTSQGKKVRHHLHETVVQKAISRAAAKSELAGRITSTVLRQSYAAELARSGADPDLIDRLMGRRQRSIKTKSARKTEDDGIRSPFDLLLGRFFDAACLRPEQRSPLATEIGTRIHA